jgi:hypothetical protein
MGVAVGMALILSVPGGGVDLGTPPAGGAGAGDRSDLSDPGDVCRRPA